VLIESDEMQVSWLLVALVARCLGLEGKPFKVQIMVTSKLDSVSRRLTLRGVFKHCTSNLHSVEHHFFLGSLDGAPEDMLQALMIEEQYGDLVFIGGPDSDPPAKRDETYVLDRPTARSWKLAYGTAWLMQQRPDLDYIVYLDDDSYVHIPKLIQKIDLHASPSLAMGYGMETELDITDVHVCTVCKLCDWCQTDAQLNTFCDQFPRLSLGGCVAFLHQCQLHYPGEDESACVRRAATETFRVATYFGSKRAPRWFLGMGWVYGRRIANFLARNVDDLKKQGAADVQLGFWLAPLEGVDWVDMSDGFFHDHPASGSSFSHGCSEASILVHRMTEERWQDFDPATCELQCPAVQSGL